MLILIQINLSKASPNNKTSFNSRPREGATAAIDCDASDFLCTYKEEIFLFGSHVTGRANEFSDIDIGIRGLAPSRFFAAYARLENEIPEKIDFVDFDEQTAFYNFLASIGELRKINSVYAD